MKQKSTIAVGPLEPEIDLHILVRNRKKYLASAIESVLKQTFGNFSLLIHDDGSADGSVEIAESFAQEDARITVIRASHQGVERSRDAAARWGSAPYLGWVDSDDILEPFALELTRKVLVEDESIGMVYTDCIDIDERGVVLGPGHRNAVPFSPMRLLTTFMTFHFRLIRRPVFEAAGGIDLNATGAEDYDLCLRLSEQTGIAHLAQALYRYRRHGETQTWANRLQQIRGSIDAVDRAIRRRGMNDEIALIPDIRTRFILVPKNAAGAARLKREFPPV